MLVMDEERIWDCNSIPLTLPMLLTFISIMSQGGDILIKNIGAGDAAQRRVIAALELFDAVVASKANQGDYSKHWQGR